jgi:hypothetical protein
MKNYTLTELINICPVCGYDKLLESPYDEFGYPSYEICSCCGFEYGFDDSNKKITFQKYRERWIDKGFQWFNKSKKPKEWNKEALNIQLKNIEKVSHFKPRIL